MKKEIYKLDIKKDSDLINEITVINESINGINSIMEHLSLKMGRLKKEERNWFKKVKIKLSITNKDFEVLVYDHENKELTIKEI